MDGQLFYPPFRSGSKVKSQRPYWTQIKWGTNEFQHFWNKSPSPNVCLESIFSRMICAKYLASKSSFIGKNVWGNFFFLIFDKVYNNWYLFCSSILDKKLYVQKKKRKENWPLIWIANLCTNAYAIGSVFLSTSFLAITRANTCRNSELDEDFGWVRL